MPLLTLSTRANLRLQATTSSGGKSEIPISEGALHLTPTHRWKPIHLPVQTVAAVTVVGPETPVADGIREEAAGTLAEEAVAEIAGNSESSATLVCRYFWDLKKRTIASEAPAGYSCPPG